MPQKDSFRRLLKDAAFGYRQTLPLFGFCLAGLAVFLVLASVMVEMDLGQAHLDHLVHSPRRGRVEVVALRFIVEA